MDREKHLSRYNGKLREPARELRKNMTRQEKHLWYDFLNTYPLKWYRQRPIDRFIVDFYCAKAKLIIEIDGAQHYEGNALESDKQRTEILNQYSLKVIRFSNNDINNHFSEVCETIDKIAKERYNKFNGQ